MRPALTIELPMLVKFQSTHPSWGATVIYIFLGVLLSISIHAPIVGCDFTNCLINVIMYLFQSTHPSWGATACNVELWYRYNISIHAPIVGCDQNMKSFARE